jgi:hypothetical protein
MKVEWKHIKNYKNNNGLHETESIQRYALGIQHYALGVKRYALRVRLKNRIFTILN